MAMDTASGEGTVIVRILYGLGFICVSPIFVALGVPKPLNHIQGRMSFRAST